MDNRCPVCHTNMPFDACRVCAERAKVDDPIVDIITTVFVYSGLVDNAQRGRLTEVARKCAELIRSQPPAPATGRGPWPQSIDEALRESGVTVTQEQRDRNFAAGIEYHQGAPTTMAGDTGVTDEMVIAALREWDAPGSPAQNRVGTMRRAIVAALRLSPNKPGAGGV